MVVLGRGIAHVCNDSVLGYLLNFNQRHQDIVRWMGALKGPVYATTFSG